MRRINDGIIGGNRSNWTTVAAATALGLLLLAGTACSSSDKSTTAPTTTAAAGGTTAAGATKKTTDLSTAELKQLQTSLNAVGCDAGPVDGIDGGETQAGIKEFQTASGLTVDGLVGPQTSAALAADVTAGKRVCGQRPGTTVTTQAGATTTTTTTTTVNPCADNAKRGSTPICQQISIIPGAGPAGTAVTVTVAASGCGLYGPRIVIWSGSTTLATGQLGAADANGNMTGTITVPAGTASGSSLLIGLVAASVDCMRPFTVG